MAMGKVAGTGPAQVASVPWPQCPAVVSDRSPRVAVSLLPSLLQESGACGWMVGARCSCPAGRQDNHFPSL